MTRSYEGPPLDGTVQYITERPALDEDDDGETVYATDPEPDGTEETVNVPTPDADGRPDGEGQTTLADFERWSV